MEQPWPSTLFDVAVVVLGVVGFFAITLLPLRAWALLRKNSGLLSTTYGRLAYGLVALAAILAIGLSASSLINVSHCLLGLHCSANRAGGWLFLITIGIWYLAFETLAFVVLATARRLLHVVA